MIEGRPSSNNFAAGFIAGCGARARGNSWTIKTFPLQAVHVRPTVSKTIPMVMELKALEIQIHSILVIIMQAIK